MRTLPKLCCKHRVYGGGDGRAMWLVVCDLNAGHLDVYTVYRIWLVGNQAAQMIGRELPLRGAQRLIKRDQEAGCTVMM